MNKKERAILYGLAIGDGHISFRERFKDGKYRYETSSIHLAHSLSQRDYLEWKRDLLVSILGGHCPKIQTRKHFLKKMQKEYTMYAFEKGNTYFRQMHRVLYSKNKKKVITEKVLSYLDDMSLAIWFMDDGSLIVNKNKQGETTSANFRICTQCSEEEAKLIVDWLQSKFDIPAKYFKAKNAFDIGGATEATFKLAKIVSPYIVKCMAYKVKPLLDFVFRKSAKHPNFIVGDDIVRSAKNEISSVEGVNPQQ